MGCPAVKPMLRFLPFLLAAAVAADPGPSVTVGGRTFPFAFEDEALSEPVRDRIASDVAALWEDQPGSVVQSGGNGAERLFNDSVWATPYQNGMDVPERLVDVGTNRCLFVSRDVSDAYQTAFSFADAHTNEVSSLARFVASLAPAALSNATPAELSARLFGEGAIDEPKRLEIIGDLAQTQFDRPSPLGFRIATGREAHAEAGTLLVAIPCHDRDSGRWELWPAAWIDGAWKLLPLY